MDIVNVSLKGDIAAVPKHTGFHLKESGRLMHSRFYLSD